AGTRPGGRPTFLAHARKVGKEACPTVSPATPVPSLRPVAPAGPELAALGQQGRTSPAQPSFARRARGEQGASAPGPAVLVAGCAQRSSMDRTRDVPTLLRSPIHRAIMGSTDPAQTVRVGTPIPLSRQAQRGQPEGPRQRGAFLYLLSCCTTRKKVARRGEIPAGRGLN